MSSGIKLGRRRKMKKRDWNEKGRRYSAFILLVTRILLRLYVHQLAVNINYLALRTKAVSLRISFPY